MSIEFRYFNMETFDIIADITFVLTTAAKYFDNNTSFWRVSCYLAYHILHDVFLLFFFINARPFMSHPTTMLQIGSHWSS